MDRVENYLVCEHTSETFGVVRMPSVVMNSYRTKSNNIEITQQPRFSMNSLMILASLPLVSLPKIGYLNTKFSYKQLSYSQGTKYAVTVVY